MTPKTIEDVKVGDTLLMVRPSTGTLEPIKIVEIFKKFGRDVHIRGTYLDTGEETRGYATLPHIISQEHQKFAQKTGLKADDFFDAENPRDNKNPINRLVAVMPTEHEPDQVIHYTTSKRGPLVGSVSTSAASALVGALKERWHETKPHTAIQVGDKVETFNFQTGNIEAVVVQKIHTVHNSCIFARVKFPDGRISETTLSTKLENNKAAALFFKETGLKPGDSIGYEDWLSKNNYDSVIHTITASPRGGYEVCFRGKNNNNFSLTQDSIMMERLREKHKNKMKMYAFNFQTAKVEECAEVIPRSIGLAPQVKFADGRTDVTVAATKEQIAAAEARFLLETGLKPGDKYDVVSPGQSNLNYEIVAIIPTLNNSFDICFKAPGGKGYMYSSDGFIAKRMRDIYSEKIKEKAKNLDKTLNNLFSKDFNDEKFIKDLNETHKKITGESREETAKAVKNLLAQMTELLNKMPQNPLDKTHDQHPEKAKAVDDFVQAYQDNGNQVSPESVLKLRENFKEFDLSLYQDFLVQDGLKGIEILLTKEKYPDFFKATPLTTRRLDGFKPIIKPEPVKMDSKNPNRHVFRQGEKVKAIFIPENKNQDYISIEGFTIVSTTTNVGIIRNDSDKIRGINGTPVAPGAETTVFLKDIYHQHDELDDIKFKVEIRKKEAEQELINFLATKGFKATDKLYYKGELCLIRSIYDEKAARLMIGVGDSAAVPSTYKAYIVGLEELSLFPQRPLSTTHKVAYRVAAVQIKKLTKQAFLAVLQKRMENAAFFLDTEYGEALIAILSGLALARVDHPKAQLLATEFQISGMAQVGNAVADEVLEALVPVFKAMFSAETEAGSARVALTDRSAEESESAQESDLGRQDTASIPLARAGSAG